MEILLSKYMPKIKLEILNCLSVFQFLEVNGFGFMFVLVLQDKLICMQEAIMDMSSEVKKLKGSKVHFHQTKQIKYF